MNTKPHSSDHHLNNQDFERVVGQDQHSQMVPMLCNEEDCFIDGSELGTPRYEHVNDQPPSPTISHLSNARPS